jgi:hypothetical protein
MTTKLPPPLPQKNLRLAAALNFFFPGAGLLYLGERIWGAILASAFVICLVSVLSIFLIGYSQYLSIALGGDIMQEGRLEQIGTVFHPAWLIGLAIAGTVIHLTSMAAFSIAKRKLESQATG